MKRFRFALQPVVVIRAHQEVRAREAFAAASQRHANAQETLRQVVARMRSLEQSLSARRSNQFNAAEAAQLLSDYGRERSAESEAERGVAVARVEMHKARLEYLEAHRQLEVVNRLEVKARNVYRLETNRVEQSELDELAGQRHQRTPALSS